MNLSRPLQVITPTLDAEVLEVLARADAAFTGRKIHRMIGSRSDRGVRLVLDRLREQGVVTAEAAGSATLYRLNREHLAAPHIESLANLRLAFIARLREEIAGWEVPTPLAMLFGSTARGESDSHSDVDIFVVRPRGIDADDEQWTSQLARLSQRSTAWTGNDSRILEYGIDELTETLDNEPVIVDIRTRGLVLAGDESVLRVKRW